ncbi:MAG: DUF4114 domain-containing protein [Myxococcales bacterium]|nr:DUF4114 domain-containing protein [Myxococcales bacterium]
MRVLPLLPLFALLSLPVDAHALTQPSGVVIPTQPGCDSGKPTGLLATFACVCTTPGVCNIGDVCPSTTSCDDGKKSTCESTMFHVWNDNTCIPSKFSGLDPVAEASTTPETFRPTCALTFSIVTRAKALFQDTFGWYNVTGSKPDPSDLHPMFGCTDGAGKTVVLDLAKEPGYKGGDIGFFLLTPESHTGDKKCAGGDCCPSTARLAKGEGYVYYSERKYNPDAAGASSYIHLLTYASKLSKTKFYFAWEDLFSGGDNGFTDLVTSVDGVQCSGGGVRCDTGKKGACAFGVTQCSAGAVSCTPVFTAKTETCDGVDEDCNGLVDDGAVCPTAGDICHDGKCVPPCGRGEFKCGPGTTCDKTSGLCVDPTCVDVKCGAGEICRAGKCGAPCGGVICPKGQTCISDACVDLCAGVKCGVGQVCRDGICFSGCSSCSGVSCESGTKCDPVKDDCVDPSCTTPCPSGTYCKAGKCVDACEGAACPPGQTCTAGKCLKPGEVADTGVTLDGAAGDASTGSDAGPDASGNKLNGEDLPDGQACSCSLPGGSTSSSLGAVALGAFAFGALRRRRPRK